MSGIETTQLTTAVLNIGQLTAKMYKEMKSQNEQQAKGIQALSERVDAVATQTADVDLKPVLVSHRATREPRHVPRGTIRGS